MSSRVNLLNIFISLIFLIQPMFLFSEARRIFIDGVFNDWDELEPIYTDISGDQLQGDVDFGKLWVANDDLYIFLCIQLGTEINMQNDNQLSIYLDTDNNTATGILINGIGAELKWEFGNRVGLFNNENIWQGNIGIVTAPTVSSNTFEIALERNATPVDNTPLFESDTIRIVFIDNGSGGDLLPDSGTDLVYVFDNSPLETLVPISIRKKNPEHLRILTYNTLHGGLFDADRSQSFKRIILAINPDIIGFEEIYDHSAEEVKNLMENLIPLGNQKEWHCSKVEPDIIAVTKYPILNTFPIEGCNDYQGNGAFLMDLRQEFGTDLLFIVAHPPCCGNNNDRQMEIDAIMAFIRDAKGIGGDLTLQSNTPIVIVGDMNLVGYAQQLETLLTGDIVDINSFGSSFTPDWDGSNFADLMPRLTDLPMFFTWYEENNSFSPGRLDFIIFSDSVLEPANSFVLFTPEMSLDTLELYGLQAEDATIASDHLPVVADFSFSSGNGTHSGSGLLQPNDFKLEQNYPNPFNSNTIIKFILPQKSEVNLAVYDINGEFVKTLLSSKLAIGSYSILWDGTEESGIEVSSGVYICNFEFGCYSKHKKMILIR